MKGKRKITSKNQNIKLTNLVAIPPIAEGNLK